MKSLHFIFSCTYIVIYSCICRLNIIFLILSLLSNMLKCTTHITRLILSNENCFVFVNFANVHTQVYKIYCIKIQHAISYVKEFLKHMSFGKCKEKDQFCGTKQHRWDVPSSWPISSICATTLFNFPFLAFARHSYLFTVFFFFYRIVSIYCFPLFFYSFTLEHDTIHCTLSLIRTWILWSICNSNIWILSMCIN